jgi:hypothetical protein
MEVNRKNQCRMQIADCRMMIDELRIQTTRFLPSLEKAGRGRVTKHESQISKHRSEIPAPHASSDISDLRFQMLAAILSDNEGSACNESKTRTSRFFGSASPRKLGAGRMTGAVRGHQIPKHEISDVKGPARRASSATPVNRPQD